MTKVLITGASGRFAKYMVEELRGDYDLVLMSRTPPPEDRADLPWIQGDLNNYEDCVRAVQGVDYIQALGAVPSPSDHPDEIAWARRQGQEPRPFDITMKTNIMGVYYLMTAAVQAGVKAVVQTGSNCAFGHGYRISKREFPFQYLPLDEKHPSDCEDSYSYSKFVGEDLLHMFTRAYGIRTYVTRPAGICPPERLQAMAENARPTTAWTEWLWGYVPSKDLATMQRLIMEKCYQLSDHEVYVANGLDTTALEPTRELVERFKPELLPLVKNMGGFQAFFSTNKAQEQLGWYPKYTWRQYLK
ncbi:MAG: NAD(P)-dependent oxidoreductase [Anaerolineales bacterium]